MSRIALTNRDVAMKQARRQHVPIVSTIAASLLSLLPIVATAPVSPDIGFLVLIAWRLLRPEMWSAKTALALGLFNDLVSGHPIGQSMALWTITFLLLDFIDSRAMYRDYWMDWLLASLLILFHIFGGWAVAALMGSRSDFDIMWPLLGLSISSYPVIARLIVALDRWRLSR